MSLILEVLAHQGNDEARWVILRHIVLHARRQQLRLVNLPGAIMLAHALDRIQLASENPATTRTGSYLDLVVSSAVRIEGEHAVCEDHDCE